MHKNSCKYLRQIVKYGKVTKFEKTKEEGEGKINYQEKCQGELIEKSNKKLNAICILINQNKQNIENSKPKNQELQQILMQKIMKEIYQLVKGK